MDIGLVYIVFAQLLWATELILVRKFFPDMNAFFLSAVGSVIGTLFYLPGLFVFKEKIAPGSWVILFIYAFTSWFLAQIFFISGIQRGLNAFTVTLATLTLPIFAVIMGMIFLKETLTLRAIIGGILIIVGFLIISLK
jgi:drug/metabolite transporter (DMT)-like permease